MKAFAIGLIFLIAVSLLAGMGMLLFPLIVVLDFFLRIILAIFLVIFAIWLLGKFIMFIWAKVFKSK